jgi:hypothetical protein
VIKVTVEIYPFGIAEEKRTIGELFIVNDCTGTTELGNYSFSINKIESDGGRHVSLGTVKKHKRYDGVWELIRKILNKKECKEWHQGLSCGKCATNF